MQASLLASVLMLLCHSGHGALFSRYDVQQERPVAVSEAQLKRRLGSRGEAIWKIPLGPALVEELCWVDTDRIYVALRMDSAALENLDHFVVRADTGRIAWRKPRKPEDRYTVLYGTDDLLLLAVDRRNGRRSLRALAADSGDDIWSFETRPPRGGGHLPPTIVTGADLVVAVDGRKHQAVGIRLSSGTELWRRRLAGSSGGVRALLTDGEHLWDPNGPLQRVDIGDGRSVWPAPAAIEIADEPPPQLDGEDLFAVADGDLIVLNGQSGALQLRTRVPENLQVSNLYPDGDRLYLRGSAPDDMSGQAHRLIAVHRASGRPAWAHETAQPSLSNLVSADGYLYHASARRIYKLNAQSGEVVFTTSVTDTGRSFPVRLRPFDDHLAYIGELVAAGVDADSGEVVFKHGLTPISAETSLNALDYSIPQLQEQMGMARSGGGSFHLGEARRFQNMANAYSRQARSYRTQAFMARSSGSTSTADSARFRALEAQGAANRASQQARTAATVEMSLSVMNLAMTLQDTWKAAGIKARIDRQLLFRRSILSSYADAENDRYVFRPHTRYRSADDHFAGVQIMHLPTGRRTFSYLSAAYRSYGLWNLVDFERARVIHHGVGLVPAEFRYSEPRRPAPLAPKIRTVESFLMAVPVRLP